MAKKAPGKKTAAKKPQPPSRRLPGDSPRHLPGDRTLADKVARILRVDHAGEYGAQRIYEGQLAVFENTAPKKRGNKPDIADELRHMAAQEGEHLRAFAQLLNERRVRPTALHPLWHVLGFALGAGTALLGPQAAMACTVAVEDVIEKHYAAQLETLGDDEPELKDLIARFRDEEIEHADLARAHEAESLPYYRLLRGVIRAGSRTAIWLSERV